MGGRIVIPVMLSSILVLLVLAVMTIPAVAAPNDNASDKSNGKPQIVSAMGTIPGKGLNVHIWVLVPHGVDKNEVVTQALAKMGAKPFVSEKFKTSGLYWDQFGDANLSNDFVPQYYNPANNPSGDLTGTILQKTHSTWNNVGSSSFTFTYVTETSRCPSLVQECPLGQYFDGYNDFGWLPLGPGILGVTWSGIDVDEADIALSTNFNWYTDGINDFDIETVLLHENGHALGLGHSEYTEAGMYAYYHGVQRVLHSDDIAGISALYPASTPPPPPSDPSIEITSPLDGNNVTGKITITASVTGVSNPTVEFSLWDTNDTWLRDLGDDGDGAPYDVSLHSKTISAGTYVIKAQIHLGGGEIVEDDITIIKEGKGGDSDDGGSTGGSCPPAKKAKGKC